MVGSLGKALNYPLPSSRGHSPFTCSISNPGGNVGFFAINLRVQAEVGHTLLDFQRGHINLKTDFTGWGLFLRYVKLRAFGAKRL